MGELANKVTAREAARILCGSPELVRKLVMNGKLHAAGRVGNADLFWVRDVRRFARAHPYTQKKLSEKCKKNGKRD